jgi:solute carrier family 24 (sodium/potassium/calcium exchanger), member 6
MASAFPLPRPRPRPRPIAHARLFYTTALVLTVFACYSFVKNSTPAVQERNARLAVRALEHQDLECRLVHGTEKRKQCDFVRANCPDEEAGLFSYLQMYYCDLANAKPVGMTIIILWVSLLFSTIGIAASDFLCINLSTIAALLGMSESLTGVTFLAFGNGSPDVFSTFAAMSTNSGSLAVGELIGAASFITAVVSGSMAITKPFKVAKKAFIRDVLFFAVAASFSLVFMADGSLRLWECIVMIAFYVFYVGFVVAWHWYLTRSRRIKLAETAARMQLHIPEQQELEAPAIEIDEEARPATERSPLIRGQSTESVYTLHAETPAWRSQEDEDDETRDRYLAELQSNMRLDRSRSTRRNTMTPIRPSLVGALEFRSVLSSLEKKGTNQPISLTRYSDDPSFQLGAQQDTSASQPDLLDLGPSIEAPRKTSASGSGRNRAVSANDAASLHISTDLLTPVISNEEAVFSATPQPSPGVAHQRPSARFLRPLQTGQSESPKLIVSGADDGAGESQETPRSANLLAPPMNTFHSPRYDEGRQAPRSPIMSPLSPGSGLQIPVLHSPHPETYHHGVSKGAVSSEVEDRSRPPSRSRSASTVSSRSASVRSIRLPAPSISPESTHELIIIDDDESEHDPRPLRWWPYRILPAPDELGATLFPTLFGWKKKSWMDRILGVVTAPSVFLLTITLPVVDSDGSEAHPETTTGAPTPAIEPQTQRPSLSVIPPDTPAATPKMGPESSPHPHRQHNRTVSDAMPSMNLTTSNDAGPQEWKRWLVFVQVFTAPFFTTTVIWANMDDDHSLRLYLRLALGSIVFSLVLLLILLITTTSDRVPKFRPLLCFLGFLVAIAWISTIANEVVGVLKAIGVILNMSDAILGLTIFAVGNSLGDLVADITVAKLGYPVMALSACFGGPMLNILLGVGLSGTYLTIRSGEHRAHKHHSKHVRFKPYELEISTTLMISGITLLVTLLGLLIVVPLNGWRMDRKVGIGLISLWCLSTLGNVIVEVLGFGGDLE